MIRNEDKRSRDYESIKNKFRPGHADYTYLKKYGIRDFRGGGRQSARETALELLPVVLQKVLQSLLGKKFSIVGAVIVQLGLMSCNLDNWNNNEISKKSLFLSRQKIS